MLKVGAAGIEENSYINHVDHSARAVKGVSSNTRTLQSHSDYVYVSSVAVLSLVGRDLPLGRRKISTTTIPKPRQAGSLDRTGV
jgi:hypothetical protein